MKLGRAIGTSILEITLLIAIPLYLLNLVNENYPGILPYDFTTLRVMLIVFGSLTTLFYFLSAATERLKARVIFEVSAITMLLIWTYFVLSGGVIHISYEGVDFTIIYTPFLILILIMLALKYPAAILRYYSERQKYSPKSTEQNSR